MAIVVNNWRLDPTRNALIHIETGEMRRLGEYHFALLITFISHANNVLSRQYLMTEVWKNRVVGTNSLPTGIHALRVALDDNGKQQRIIKTVPRKGYVFSKEFVSEWQDDAAEARADEWVHSEIAALNQPPSEAEQTTVAYGSTPAPAPDKKRLMILTACGVALASLALMVFYGTHQPVAMKTAPAIQLKSESYPALDSVTIMHVAASTHSGSTTPILQEHLAPALERINTLLASHQSTATIYYHVSPTTFSLNFLIHQRCPVTWQLIQSYANWQGQEQQMEARIYRSVERTINEMPACEK